MSKDYKYYSDLAKRMTCRIEKNDKRYDEFKKFKKKYKFRIEETWNLNYEMILWLLPRLAYFRDNHCGIPSSLCEYDASGNFINEQEAVKKWRKILNLMLRGFEVYVNTCFDLEIEDSDRKKIDIAFRYLKEYFDDLWD